MKQLVLMRGVPGAGKSTFIKENGLEPYTISPDELRQMHTSPVYNEQGMRVISQKHDNQVWDNLMEILEERMINGDFTVIDATHSTGKLIKKYETLARKYRYRTYVVTVEQDLDTLIERNNQKEIVEETWNNEQIESAKEYLKDMNRTLLFEVIDNINDPHIIYEAGKRRVVLLDAIDNTLKFNKLFNETLVYVAVNIIGIDKNISTPHFSFSNWNDLFNFYKDLERDSSIAIEGFVFEDNSGFMLKYKTPYYNNWKYMRSLVESLSKGNLQRRPIQAILQKDKTLTNFYYWAKQQDKECLENDIITLRNDYYKETQD